MPSSGTGCANTEAAKAAARKEARNILSIVRRRRSGSCTPAGRAISFLAMPPKLAFLCVLSLPVWAQSADTVNLDAQAAALRALIQQAPRLAVDKAEFKIQPSSPDFGIGYPSSVAMDDNGLIYVLQRSEEPGRPPARGKADPVIVVNREGKIVRSWGKGLYKIPHSIRIDPAGNIWTVDAASSLVLKFTPKGEKLMEISVGGQPESKRGFNGTTDIAFAPNGHLFIFDVYGNDSVI